MVKIVICCITWLSTIVPKFANGFAAPSGSKKLSRASSSRTLRSYHAKHSVAEEPNDIKSRALFIGMHDSSVPFPSGRPCVKSLSLVTALASACLQLRKPRCGLPPEIFVLDQAQGASCNTDVQMRTPRHVARLLRGIREVSMCPRRPPHVFLENTCILHICAGSVEWFRRDVGKYLCFCGRRLEDTWKTCTPLAFWLGRRKSV